MPIGVKISEIDASLYSNSSYANPYLAIIGTATKGPVGVPTLCVSQNDLRVKFGLQDPKCFGLYAANYFLAESNRCIYIRVGHEDSLKPSSVEVKGTTDSTEKTLFTVKSTSPGTFYDGYKITVSDATDDSFSITVTSVKNQIVVPKFTVSLDEEADNYIGKTFNDKEMFTVEIADAEGVPTNGTYVLAGGNNGVEGITDAEYIVGLEKIASDTFPVDLVVVPGVSDPAVISKGLSVCESRGDALYVVDPPSGLDYEECIAWHNGSTEDYTHASFNSSYGAVYWSWQYIYDEVNAQEILVPPSVVVPAMFARSENTTRPWYAPAGLTRGVLKNVIRSEFVPDSAMQEALYTDPNNINPIITHATSGLVVFGQKTLWRQPTSLNRVNVRRLTTHIKRIAKEVYQFLTFEPNDSTTWNSFQDLLEPRLRSIQVNRGLYEYKIIKGEDIVTDDDIDNYRMPAQILIKPTKSAEYIPIDIVLTPTGVNYSEYNSAYAEEI